MNPLSTSSADVRRGFDDVVAPFLQQPGLPFAEVLDARTIERAFASRNALFAVDEVFSTSAVLLAFLGQVLRDGKGAACAAAVTDIAIDCQQRGRPAPCGDTGDYCRARAKLDPGALRALTRQAARQLDARAPADWRWEGRPIKLVDGFTFTMPDTQANQSAYPQQAAQTPGLGHPIARAVAVLSLATGALHDLALGPLSGKQTGESALLRGMLDSFDEGDVAVFDRHYGSFIMLALLRARGVDVCTRLHQTRKLDADAGTMRRAGRPGADDQLMTWVRPDRPTWMSERDYQQLPETMTVRLVRLRVTDSSKRVERMTIVTTLTDAAAYPADAVAALYGYRWYAELDIRDIKQTLGLDHLRCKSPQMVRHELWVTLLGYNLIRKVMAMSATLHEKRPRRLSFTLTCQEGLAAWLLLATGRCLHVEAQAHAMLERIARTQVGKRPGRIEPRVIKRRPKPHRLMTKPRDQMRADIRNCQEQCKTTT